jgi:hypothetical protein
MGKKWRWPQKKSNLFLIPLKFRGKPFLGLAQLSKIFIIINTWHDINDINIFPTYLSIAIKEVGGDEVRSRRGAPKTLFKISWVKIPSKVCTFYSLLLTHQHMARYKWYKHLSNIPFHRNKRGRRWWSKVKERCSKDFIQNKLSQNPFQSMHFLFVIINTWHDINYINIFPTYLSFAIKEVGGDAVRSRRGAPKTLFKISWVKIPSKVCTFYSLLSTHAMI